MAQESTAIEYSAVWSIGIFAGPSPLDIHPIPGIVNPVLTRHHVTDLAAGFVADPFMLHTQAGWSMFFEVYDVEKRIGKIGLATSHDALHWQYEQIVLDEPFHLSYPYVFAWNGDYYMVPESFQAQSVRLYKASQFPTKWKYQCTLVEGPRLVDSSIFSWQDRWWMFTETFRDSVLRLFYAEHLTGRWREHAKSPLIVDGHIGRPAGRVIVWNGHPVRFAQDCRPRYGTAVRAFAITELSPQSYAERQLPPDPILPRVVADWNCAGMHHIDAHQLPGGDWLASVDGQVPLVGAPTLWQRHSANFNKTQDIPPSPMSRRLLIVHDDTVNGGAAHVAKRLALGLQRSFSVEFACHCNASTEVFVSPLMDRGIKVHHIAVSEGNIWQSTYSMRNAVKLLDEASPDLVLCVDCEIASLLALKTAARRRRLPYVVVNNGIHADCLERFAPVLDEAIAGLRGAQAIVFGAADGRRKFEAMFPEIPIPQVVTPYFCPDEYFQQPDPLVRTALRASLGIAEDELVCFTAARIDPLKGQMLALKALELLKGQGRINGIRLVLAGPGNDRYVDHFMREVDRFGLSRFVTILGERHDIAQLLDASDLFVLPSFAEGWPLAITEALAKGVPVVATAVGAIADQIDDSSGVLLPSPADDEGACIEKLAQTLARLDIARDELRTMGIAARERASACFRPEIVMAQYAKLLDDIPMTDSISYPCEIEMIEGLSAGSALDFSDPVQIWNYLGDGWSSSETDGMWTDGRTSEITLPFVMDAVERLRLLFEITPFVTSEVPVQQTDVRVNGRIVDSWQISRPRQIVSTAIGSSELGGTVELTLLHHHPRAPCDVGASNDSRQLALFVHKMTAEEVMDLSPDSLLDFSHAQIWNYLGNGWSSSCEDTGIWTEGRESKITFKVTTERIKRARLLFEITPLVTSEVPVQQTDVYVNGRIVESWQISRHRQTESVDLSLDELGTVIALAFHHHGPKSPYQRGVCDDRRELALFFHNAWFKAACDHIPGGGVTEAREATRRSRAP